MEIGTYFRRSTTVRDVWVVVGIVGSRLSLRSTRSGNVQHVDASSTLIPVVVFA